jgi:hypothetical protein
MTKDEALDLALEALGLYQAAGFGNSTDFNKQHDAFYKAQTAIIAIKQARALDKKAENARELGLDYEPPCKTGSQCTSKCEQCVEPAQPAPVQDKVTLIQTNVGIGNRAMEAYEAAKERDRADRSAPVQEPVAWMYEDMMGLVGVRVQKEKPIVARPVTPLYTTPPGGRQSEDCLTAAQRQSARSAWVGLTDEEVMNATRKEGHELLDFIYEYGTGSEGTEERVVAICKAIEAKLKEKNT